MRFHIASFRLALTWMVLAAAPGTVNAEEPPTAAVQDYRLDNGLRVVLAPDPLIGEVTIAAVYAGGQSIDPPQRRGLSHLIEHLTFRGSRHLTPLASDAILSNVGAAWNAYTSLDETVYLTQLPERALATALWIESERMGFTLDGIDQAALELEQRIVINELAERSGSLSIVLREWRHRLLVAKDTPLF